MPFVLKDPGSGVRRSAVEYLTALHAAKMELALEMEANLKQLKAVLEETQRIAKEMEAVLEEAKGEQNKENGSGQQGHAKKAAGDDPWDPPYDPAPESGKKQAKAKGQISWEDESEDDDSAGGQQSKSDDEQIPPWEPPGDSYQDESDQN